MYALTNQNLVFKRKVGDMECPKCQYGMYPYDQPLSNDAEACPRCGEPLTPNTKSGKE